MQYLTYEEYIEIGGMFDTSAFNRNIDRVCGIVTNHTQNRIECMSEVPSFVKSLCRDLIDYMANNNMGGATISSKSQSAGAVSESESYVVKTESEILSDIDSIIYDYLASETDDFGTPLLYKGCLR